jgi:hypothetical protein
MIGGHGAEPKEQVELLDASACPHRHSYNIIYQAQKQGSEIMQYRDKTLQSNLTRSCTFLGMGKVGAKGLSLLSSSGDCCFICCAVAGSLEIACTSGVSRGSPHALA